MLILEHAIIRHVLLQEKQNEHMRPSAALF